MKRRLFSGLVYLAASLLGALTFLYPFFMPWLVEQGAGDQAGRGTPLSLALLLGLCVLVLLYEVQRQALNMRLVALLGMLVAMNAGLRFLEVAIPGPGGFTPIFFLIILVGYVYGGRVGFLMGALTMLVSALVTGGVGPWLPGQMFAAGWVGMSAPLCRLFFPGRGKKPRRAEVLALAVFGAGWGFAYGAVMNLWSWPYMAGPADQYWTPGISLADTLQRYALYYLVTSFTWDLVGAAGTVVLILAFGAPALQALRRFHQRFFFEYRPFGLPAPEMPGD